MGLALNHVLPLWQSHGAVVVKVNNSNDLVARKTLEMQDVARGLHLGEGISLLVIRDADVVMPEIVLLGILHFDVKVRIGARNVGRGFQFAAKAIQAVCLAMLNEIGDFDFVFAWEVREIRAEKVAQLND